MVLCSACVDQLQILSATDRCTQCFTEGVNPHQRICCKCLFREPLFDEVASVFDYYGPAASLVSALKYSNKPWISDLLGPYLVVQWEYLKWPIPDVIVPVPISWNRSLRRGYNQSELLARSMARYLNVPVSKQLKRYMGGYSQASLSKEKRLELDQEFFYLTKDFYDKTILLIDDVITTGATLRKCGETLIGGCPSKVFALSLARA